MTEQQVFTDEQADAIYSQGLALARNNQEKEAIEVWLPLARTGDLSTIENIIYASSMMGDFDQALPWLARFSNSEFDSVVDISKKLGLPLDDLYWFIAENQNTSIEVLTKLAKHSNRNIRWAVATNPVSPVPLVIEIAESAHEITFEDLGDFECDSCGKVIDNFELGQWEEDAEGLCEHCYTALSVDDIQCYSCKKRVVDVNSPSKVEKYFEEKCNSGLITDQQFEYILEGFNTDGGQLIGLSEEVLCLECDHDDQD